MKLQIKKLTEDAVLPVKCHAADSGFDLFANENVIIEPGQRVAIKTGIAIMLPEGHEAQIRPKSGISLKTDLDVKLGTVDEGYTGEIKVIVKNTTQIFVVDIEGEEDLEKLSVPCLHDVRGLTKITKEEYPLFTYEILKGQKIAQMVIAPVAHPEVVEVDELGETDRGVNGFGSTGVTAK